MDLAPVNTLSPIPAEATTATAALAHGVLAHTAHTHGALANAFLAEAAETQTENPIRAGRALDDEKYHALRRRAVLEGCKWDPQVGDTETLARFPLVIAEAEWRRLAAWAEELAAEAGAAEEEVAERRPELIGRLGLPRALRRVLQGNEPWTPAAARMIRFDFHFTREGWRISEANSDVPGGYTEASFFTRLFAEQAAASGELVVRPNSEDGPERRGVESGIARPARTFQPVVGERSEVVRSANVFGLTPHSGHDRTRATDSMSAGPVRSLRAAGDPASAWVETIAAEADGPGPIGLLAAPGYMEDLQIMAYLAKLLAAQGRAAWIGDPGQVVWENRLARCLTRDRAGGARALANPIRPTGRIGRADNAGDSEACGALVRFYQSEWLARAPRSTGWHHFFRGGRTPVMNPGIAVISESKRFPLTWPSLTTRLPRWKALLPETRDPREVPWRTDRSWLLKSAMCNTGDAVAAPDLVPAAQWRKAAWAARWFPGGWIAQRRFETLPIPAPTGESMFPCLGVYTLNGRCCGAYARLGRTPVVNYAAMDAALLVETETQPRG